jgi:CTP synthase (UTP-ammonia lyase)
MTNLVECDCCTRLNNRDFLKGNGYNTLSLDDQTKEGEYSINTIKMCDHCTREIYKAIMETKEKLRKKFSKPN